MSKLPTREENPKGLHQRYQIRKANGDPVYKGAEYFVLRLDTGGEEHHVDACRAAIREYAWAIRPYQTELAEDLEERYGES